MKKEYDFSKGKGRAVMPAKGKTQVTIRLDDEVLDWFRAETHKAGGGHYAVMINDALRRVLREELQNTV